MDMQWHIIINTKVNFDFDLMPFPEFVWYFDKVNTSNAEKNNGNNGNNETVDMISLLNNN